MAKLSIKFRLRYKVSTLENPQGEAAYKTLDVRQSLPSISPRFLRNENKLENDSSSIFKNKLTSSTNGLSAKRYWVPVYLYSGNATDRSAHNIHSNFTRSFSQWGMFEDTSITAATHNLVRTKKRIKLQKSQINKLFDGRF